VEELEDEFVVTELDQWRDLGMSEGGGVRSADDRAQVFAGEFIGGYVEREDGDGEVDKGVGFPFVLPVGGQSRDALWDVEAAVGREASQDGLDRAGRGHQNIAGLVKEEMGLTSSKVSRSAPPRVEKYFIESSISTTYLGLSFYKLSDESLLTSYPLRLRPAVPHQRSSVHDYIYSATVP